MTMKEFRQDIPVVSVAGDDMISKNHSVLVRPYMFGQYRIQLTRIDRPDPFAPPGHGSICRELCTYDHTRMMATVLQLVSAKDPEAYCCTLETPSNCEVPGSGRIRLDNAEGED
jgi:hypothetical protein